MVLIGLWCIQTVPTSRPLMSRVPHHHIRRPNRQALGGQHGEGALQFPLRRARQVRRHRGRARSPSSRTTSPPSRSSTSPRTSTTVSALLSQRFIYASSVVLFEWQASTLEILCMNGVLRQSHVLGDAKTDESALVITGIKGRINRAVWGLLNRTIVTAREDATIRIWDSEVVLGGGQDAMNVTMTDRRAGKFEAKFYHKILQEEIGGVKEHFGPLLSRE